MVTDISTSSFRTRAPGRSSTTNSMVTSESLKRGSKAQTGASLSVAQPNDIYTSGDFNADGKTDLALNNSTTNALYLWQMNGIVKTSGGAFVPASTTDAVQGAGDFNGDGRTDLVFQDPTSGAVVIWHLGPTGTTGINTTRTASATISPQLTSFTAQRVVGVTDCNGDGHPDLLIEEVRTTGATAGNVTVILLNAGLQSSATITRLSTRSMVPQNFDDAPRFTGACDGSGQRSPHLSADSCRPRSRPRNPNEVRSFNRDLANGGSPGRLPNRQRPRSSNHGPPA